MSRRVVTPGYLPDFELPKKAKPTAEEYEYVPETVHSLTGSTEYHIVTPSGTGLIHSGWYGTSTPAPATLASRVEYEAHHALCGGRIAAGPRRLVRAQCTCGAEADRQLGRGLWARVRVGREEYERHANSCACEASVTGTGVFSKRRYSLTRGLCNCNQLGKHSAVEHAPSPSKPYVPNVNASGDSSSVTESSSVEYSPSAGYSDDVDDF